jgi:hypothetical protein
VQVMASGVVDQPVHQREIELALLRLNPGPDSVGSDLQPAILTEEGRCAPRGLEHFNKRYSHKRQTNRGHPGASPWSEPGRWR